jgi:hypothetical protein
MFFVSQQQQFSLSEWLYIGSVGAKIGQYAGNRSV